MGLAPRCWKIKRLAGAVNLLAGKPRGRGSVPGHDPQCQRVADRRGRTGLGPGDDGRALLPLDPGLQPERALLGAGAGGVAAGLGPPAVVDPALAGPGIGAVRGAGHRRILPQRPALARQVTEAAAVAQDQRETGDTERGELGLGDVRPGGEGPEPGLELGGGREREKEGGGEKEGLAHAGSPRWGGERVPEGGGGV